MVVPDWPGPQSQSFSRSYGSILPTSLIYIVLSTRGFTPWRPDAVISTPGGASNTCIMARAGIFKDPPQGTGLNVEDMLCETGFDRIAPTEAGFGACSSGASTLSPSKSIPGCRCFMLPVNKLRDSLPDLRRMSSCFHRLDALPQYPTPRLRNINRIPFR